MSRALEDLVRELTLAVIATAEPTPAARSLVLRAVESLRTRSQATRRPTVARRRIVAPVASNEPQRASPPFFGRGTCPSCARRDTSLFSGIDGPVCRDCLTDTDTDSLRGK